MIGGVARDGIWICAGTCPNHCTDCKSGTGRTEPLYIACLEMVTERGTHKKNRKVVNDKAHELTVYYTVDGTVYIKVVGALLKLLQAINEGDKIELRYIPDNTKKAVLTETMNPQKNESY